MGFNPTVRAEEVFKNEDRRWLASRKGYDTCRSITLDMSTFSSNHLTAKGAIPSGTALAKITSTGKYGPYKQGASQINTATIDGTGGTWTLVVNGDETGNIAYNATAAAVQTALEALPGVDPGDVAVTGNAGGPYTLTWGGRLAGTNVTLTANDALTGGAGTVTIAQTQNAAEGATDGLGEFMGFLFSSVIPETGDVSTAVDPGAALVWEGIIDTAKLPTFANTNDGELDAVARNQAGARFFRFE